MRQLLPSLPFPPRFVRRPGGWALGLLVCLAAQACRTQAWESTSTTPSRPSTEARSLFRVRCVRCHDHGGAGVELRDLHPNAPDFTDPKWQHSRTTTHLVVSILEGKGTRMPAFGGKLSRGQARQLAVYVRSLSPEAATATDGADDFEVRFRELQEEFDRLTRQLDALAPRRKR
jgi:mono/diheme cytochrome c family protein